MSVRITSQENRVALFDSVTGFAFGPTFEDEDSVGHFLAWLRDDPRGISVQQLSEAYERWLSEAAL